LGRTLYFNLSPRRSAFRVEHPSCNFTEVGSYFFRPIESDQEQKSRLRVKAESEFEGEQLIWTNTLNYEQRRLAKHQNKVSSFFGRFFSRCQTDHERLVNEATRKLHILGQREQYITNYVDSNFIPRDPAPVPAPILEIVVEPPRDAPPIARAQPPLPPEEKPVRVIEHKPPFNEEDSNLLVEYFKKNEDPETSIFYSETFDSWLTDPVLTPAPSNRTFNYHDLIKMEKDEYVAGQDHLVKRITEPFDRSKFQRHQLGPNRMLIDSLEKLLVKIKEEVPAPTPKPN